MSSNNCNSLWTPVKHSNQEVSVNEANSDVTSTVEVEHSNSCPSSSLAYSDSEALSIIDKLKCGNSGLSFVTLKTWLQTRQINENNSQQFYSVLESINDYVHSCIRKEEQFQKEHQETTKTMKKERQNVLLEINDIKNVFTLVNDKKILNCFNDEQKNGIQLLNDQINELAKAEVEVEGRNNGSSSSTCTTKINVNNLVEKLKDLQKEKETLRRRLTASRAYQVELRAKRERQREAYKREMFVLLHELQRMQGRLDWLRGVEDLQNNESRKRKKG